MKTIIHKTPKLFSIVYSLIKKLERCSHSELYLVIVGVIFLSLNPVFAQISEESVGGAEETLSLEEGLSSSKLETFSTPKLIQESQEPRELEEYEKYFYKYESSFGIRLGGNHDFGSPPESEDEESSAHLGFFYMFQSYGKSHLEVGGELFPKREELFIYGAWKVVYNFTEAFRPHHRLGAALKLDSGDTFNTPLKSNNYFVLAGVGFEDLIRDPLSFRLDLDFYISKVNVLFLLSAGVVYAF